MDIKKEIDKSFNISVSDSVNHSVTFITRMDVVRRVHRLVGFDIVDMLHAEMTAHGISTLGWMLSEECIGWLDLT